MYIISENKHRAPIQSQTTKYIKSIKTLQSLENEIAKIDPLLKLCFNGEVLGHKNIPSKLHENFILMILIAINDIFLKKLTKLTQREKRNIASAIRKLYNDTKDKKVNKTGIKPSGNSVKNTDEFINRLTVYYNDFDKKTQEVIDDDVSEENSEDTENKDDSDDDTSSSEEEKIVVRKKQQKPTPTVKKQVVVRKITKK